VISRADGTASRPTRAIRHSQDQGVFSEEETHDLQILGNRLRLLRIVSKRPSDVSATPPPFARSAALTYGTQIVAAFLSLLSVLIVARALGAEGRGNVAFLTAITFLTANLATFGLQEANANFAASDPRARPALATNSVLLSLVLGGAAIAVLSGLIALVPAVAGESDPTLRWMAFAFIPAILLQILLRFLVQADYGFVVTNTAFLLAPALNVLGNGLFYAFGILSVGTAIGWWLAGQMLETVILAWYVQHRLAGFGRPDPALARRAFRFGARAHPGRIMLLGNYRLDQWLLGAIAGPRELGVYSVAVAWAEALWYLPTALAFVQRPDLVRAAREEAARLAARVFRAAILITALFGLVMFAAAPILCVVIFGDEFRDSVGMLRILVVASLGVTAIKLLGSALVARGSPGLQSLAIGAGFVCSVALDIALIPPFGGTGAAVAAALAHTAAGLVVATIFIRTLDARASDLVPRTGDVAWFVGRLRERFGAGGRTAAPSQPDANPAHGHADPVRDVKDHEGRDHARQQAEALAARTDGAHAEDEGADEVDGELEREEDARGSAEGGERA
jgi:O-antigen/teichoic acid export membrane protein